MPAYDFFATASTMHDWWLNYCRDDTGKINPLAKWEPPTDPSEAAIFRLCGDVGNGAKHLSMQHKAAVRRHERQFNSEHAKTASQRRRGVLVLELRPREAKILGVSAIPATTLAAAVLNYWSAWENHRRHPLSRNS